MRETEHKQKEKWREHYENWKRIWRNPEVSVYTKVILQDLFFYRSDGEGWYVSERKFVKDLNISRGRVRKSINEAIKNGWLLTNETKEKQRRKLRLSGSLRSPDWTIRKSSIWVSREPIKYQREYQNNSSFENGEREGKMTKLLSLEESSKYIEAVRRKNSFLWRRKDK